MVEVCHGNLFDSKASTLVNAVNCVGVMGAGIAAEFKRRFPDMFEVYRTGCLGGWYRLGEPWAAEVECPGCIAPCQLTHVVNFPTKKHWQDPANPEAIVTGIRFLSSRCEDWGIASLAVPALGCGLGGLPWEVFGTVLISEFSHFNIPVELYAPLS